MDPLGTILDIAHILKRAYDLYTGCQSAAEEIQLAAEYVHTMALVLEGVKSDLIDNHRSIVHQTTALAKTRIQNLKSHIGQCEKSLKRMEGLLKKYNAFKKKHVALWDKFRWSTEGKKEIADCKADLILATSTLDLFLSKEGLSVLWRLEAMMEAMMKKIGALDLLAATAPVNEAQRPRSKSNVTRTLVLSLVIARLKKALMNYRTKKRTKKGPKTSKAGPGSKRPKPVTRVSSGFTPSAKRNSLLQHYANNIANASAPQPYEPKGARTPSPDFYYNPGPKDPSPPRLTRRSSSMNRIMNRINANITKPKNQYEHYECWKVGIGKLAIGGKTAPQFLQHRRGQMQLRKMGAIFKDSNKYAGKGALNERDSRVKLILNKKNEHEKDKKSGRVWYLVAARVIGRDPGKTGMVTVEKAMVILVRR